MMRKIFALVVCAMCSTLSVMDAKAFEKDVIPTSAGDLEITFIGHGTLMLTFGDKIIHVDPYSRLTDYSKLPKADLILLTHQHQDHLDPAAMQKIRKENTVMILTRSCAESIKGGIIMTNGETRTVSGIKIDSIPAYNLTNKRPDGQPYHPKGEGNGYVLTFADKRIYIAGDTENTQEMKALANIDCAFLPMNLPYTMTPEMCADAARAFKPKILYPYHFGETDTTQLVKLLKDSKDIEVRIRKMK
jgi:L-ascorbate metabolism protein UlaG (beta-lactamase superfamily)